MTTLTIDNAIFSTLRADTSVNPEALQRFVAIADSHPVWHAAPSADPHPAAGREAGSSSPVHCKAASRA